MIGERLQDRPGQQAALRVAHQINARRMRGTNRHQIGAQLIDLPPGILQARPTAETIRIVDDCARMRSLDLVLDESHARSARHYAMDENDRPIGGRHVADEQHAYGGGGGGELEDGVGSSSSSASASSAVVGNGKHAAE